MKAVWLVCMAMAAGPVVAAGTDSTTVVCRDLGHGRVFARAACNLAATPADVMALLTDFGAVADYVGTVDSSRVVGRDSLGIHVRQVATSHFLFDYTVRLTLRFRLESERVLRFEIVEGDFPVYFGDWTCAPAGNAARLTYTVTCKPPAFVPRAIACHVIERDLRRLMPEIAAELARRRAGE